MKNDLFDRIQRAILKQEDKPDKGFKTAREWANEWKVPARQAREMLRQAIEKKIVEQRDFRRRYGGQLRPVPHYGPK